MKREPGQDESRLRQRLLQRIGRCYQTVTETRRIGRLEMPFTRIADPDRVLDQVAEAEDVRLRLAGPKKAEALHLPYWAELWDSAGGIGAFLVRAFPPADASPLEVLDLGCGMGLAGSVAAALGHRVLFADLEQPALLFAQLNSLPWRHRVRTRQLNWQTDRLHERFDLILGADILYEKSQWQHLEPFWRHHLDVNGTILLGEPGRQSGEGFLQWIAGQPWTVEQFEEPVATRPRPIRIFRLRRSRAQ